MRFSLHRFISVVFLTLLPLSFCGTVQDEFNGLSGKSLADKVVGLYRPNNYLNTTEDIYKHLSNYLRDENGVYIEYFSSKCVDDVRSLTLLRVVAESWWNSSDSAFSDLNNIVGANSEVIPIRGDFPPGVVSDAFYNNGFWQCGEADISAMNAGVYEPADRFKGDFARIYMYMSLIYPQKLWCGRGSMLFLDGGYPFLTAYGRDLLMKWHRQDPVDEFELRRNEEIAKAQSSGNPFVEIPMLAEYLWGAHVGENFGGEVSENVCDILLKGKYSRSHDGHICFKSQYVPTDALWTFDGKSVGTRLQLDDISDGKHEISYQTSNSRGKLIVIVEP